MRSRSLENQSANSVPNESLRDQPRADARLPRAAKPTRKPPWKNGLRRQQSLESFCVLFTNESGDNPRFPCHVRAGTAPHSQPGARRSCVRAAPGTTKAPPHRTALPLRTPQRSARCSHSYSRCAPGSQPGAGTFFIFISPPPPSFFKFLSFASFYHCKSSPSLPPPRALLSGRRQPYLPDLVMIISVPSS